MNKVDVNKIDEKWQSLEAPTGERYDWDEWSTYARKPPFFDGIPKEPTSHGANRELGCLR